MLDFSRLCAPVWAFTRLCEATVIYTGITQLNLARNPHSDQRTPPVVVAASALAEALRQCSGLESLWLDGHVLDDAAVLQAIAGLSCLTTLSLRHCTGTQVGAAATIRGSKYSVLQVADVQLLPILATGRLQRLDLTGCTVTPQCLAAAPATCANLRSLSISALHPCVLPVRCICTDEYT